MDTGNRIEIAVVDSLRFGNAGRVLRLKSK